jgi:WD40 repeat protein
VRTWDVKTGRELLKFSVNAINADVIGFSPDGRTLVTQEVFLGRGIEPVVTIWDAAGGVVLGRIPVEHAMSRALAVMPNADRLAVASEKGLQIWDIQKRNLLTTLKATGVVLQESHPRYDPPSGRAIILLESNPMISSYPCDELLLTKPSRRD